MNSDSTKNSIISFILIVSTILMPLSFIPKKAEAQSMGAYTSGLSGAILALPQCGAGKLVGSGIKSLFNSVGDLLNGGSGFGDLSTNQMDSYMRDLSANNPELNANLIKNGTNNLPTAASSAASQIDSIKVSLPATTEQKLNDIKTNTDATKQSIDSINANSTCIQSIGRLVIKMLLQKLTMSTVNWINTGFNGSPSFVQDPVKFFNDIAKTEILKFGAEITGINPYSKDWLKNQALAINKKFADNATYSLDDMIAATTPGCPDKNGVQVPCGVAFSQDFSVGGWDAWTAMTQVPANNPLGFKLMADNEIAQRLAGTVQSTAQNTRDALTQASGFLGDMRCSDPKDVTKEEDARALNGDKNARRCTGGFQYVTPGKMIADAATNVIGYQNNAYLNVTDLNDAVAAVTDALLSQFSSSIIEKGFANIGDQGANGALVFNSSSTSDNRSQTQQDFMPSQLSSSWLQANPDFNIRTDLTQALIDEQRTYSDKLALQNKELNSTTDGRDYQLASDGQSSNAYGLIPAIYQLDYCIPGPHPGWENDSQQILTNKITPAATPQTDNSLGAVIGNVVNTAVSSIPIVGGILSSLFGSNDADTEKKQTGLVRFFYTEELFHLTSYYANPDILSGNGSQPAINLTTKEGLQQVMNVILNRYDEIMNKTYFSSPDILPPVTKEATTEFNQLKGYDQMIKDNEDKITSFKMIVNTLGDIKDKVNELNSQLSDGVLLDYSGQIASDQKAEYENQLKDQINAFGRLSSSMVNGDDIASVDNLTKQIIDKKVYIYNNLLKGLYGCEAWLANPSNIKNFPSAGTNSSLNIPLDPKESDWPVWNINSVKRMTYPSSLPILYDYNYFSVGANIRDPWKSGIKTPNTIPAREDKLGPGFLSFVFFSNLNKFGSQRLYTGDLVLQGTAAVNYVSLGTRTEIGNAMDRARTGVFETTIGIY